MTAEEVCDVLRPLFDVAAVTGFNGPAGWRLAQLIKPRDAADLTVREVLDLVELVRTEQRQ